jgi:phosphatidylinositol alpha-mannosyltransferase
MTGYPTLKIGIVCPYSFDVPGGVQAHVTDLARVLRRLGHEVEVLAPADIDSIGPDFFTPSGRAVRVPYNGSVARLAFGPVSFARVRRWIREHEFDVLHLHEPVVPSVSMLALMIADGPIVATFHASTPRSRVLNAFGNVLQPFLEKITGRIAVSALARRLQVEHLGSDALEIPNGVDVAFYAKARPLPGYPRAGWRRCASWRRGGRTCGCSSSAPATPTHCWPRPGRCWRRGWTCSGWSMTRSRPGRCEALTSTARRTPAGRASGSS